MLLDPGCLLGVTRQGESCRIRFPGITANAARLLSAVNMVQVLAARDDSRAFARAAGGAVGTVFQHGDHAERALFSVAYGRRATGEEQVELIPDAYFFDKNGYGALNAALLSAESCGWATKQPRLVWRGSSTFNPRDFPRTGIDPATIPRVALCRELKRHGATDAVITNKWEEKTYFADGTLELYLQQQDLWGGRMRPEEMARFKFQIDIDGVANAWSLYEKLLAGSCVLRIASPFMLWYHHRLQPWEHYVPVRADRSDLLERLDWCLSHDVQAGEIGAAGRALALSMTMERESAVAVAAINRASFLLPS